MFQLRVEGEVFDDGEIGVDDIVIDRGSCDHVKATRDDARRTEKISWKTYIVLGSLLLVAMLIIAAILIIKRKQQQQQKQQQLLPFYAARNVILNTIVEDTKISIQKH